MGYAVSYLAVRGKQPSEILEILALRPSGAREQFPESPFVGTDLKNGWYLVAANEYSPSQFAKTNLAELSKGAELLICLVEEHCMASSASGWKQGIEQWSVYHDGGSDGIDHLECAGELPGELAEIEQKQRREQIEDPDADNIFEIPIELFRSFTSYRYDEAIDLRGEDAFEVLVQSTGQASSGHASTQQSQSSKPWWKVW